MTAAIKYTKTLNVKYAQWGTLPGNSVNLPVISSSVGYIDTALGRALSGGSGIPRPVTGWLWPRT